MPRQYGSLSNRFFSGSVMLWMAVMIFWGMEWLFHMTKPSVLSVLITYSIAGAVGSTARVFWIDPG
jgi:hypothetical protein